MLEAMRRYVKRCMLLMLLMLLTSRTNERWRPNPGVLDIRAFCTAS